MPKNAQGVRGESKNTTVGMSKSQWLRMAVMVLLAAFLANATNKFFVPDLEYEAAHSFYAKIFEFQGEAPDQYRILPLLPIKFLTQTLPFHSAVLVYNFIFALAWLVLMQRLMRGFTDNVIWLTSFGFCCLYIYLQYTGWRPDTMGLLVLAATWVDWGYSRRNTWQGNTGLLVGIAALGFSRADFALAAGLFASFYWTQNWMVRIGLVLIPVISQLLIQFVLFPDASYYTQTWMLSDNLSGYYLVRNPATYLFLAYLLLDWERVKKGFIWLKNRYPAILWISAGYILLVFGVGRLNEFRIFLPFLPLFMVLCREMHSEA
jgi:hypothetical protein